MVSTDPQRPTLRQSALDRTPPQALVWALASLTMAAWLGSILAGGSAFDDVEGVFRNPLVNGTRPLWAAFLYDYWHHLGDAGHYRPVAVLSLALDQRLFGAEPRGFHTTSVLLHAAVVFFAAAFARLALSPRAAWAACLGLVVFAIHPAQADSVAWISGRSSPLSLLPGVFFGWWYVAHGRQRALSAFWCALGAILLGALAKEDGVFGSVLVLLVASRAGSRPRLAAVSGLVLGLAVYLGLRYVALGSALPFAPHAPLAGAALDARLAAAGGALAAAARCLVWPLDLAPAWRAASWPSQLTQPTALLGWGLWLATLLVAFGLRTRQRAVALSLALSALVWVPVQQWLPAGEIFAPRFLYQPLFFLALPLGAGLLMVWRRVPPKWTARALLTLGLGLLLLLPMDWRAAGTYSSLHAYETATLARFPDDAKAWNGLGLAEEERANVTGARNAYRQAIVLDPTYGRPHSNLGRLELAAGRTAAARAHFEAAVELGPGNPIAWCNLGSLELRADAPESARAAYTRATLLAPGSLVAWRGLARAEWARGEPLAAREALDRALRLDPKDPASRTLDASFEQAQVPVEGP